MPTVAELIERLRQYPMDKPVVIDDADTGWAGPIIHINEYENAVELSIVYDEMDSLYNLGPRAGMQDPCQAAS